MKTFYGTSSTGNLSEAVNGLKTAKLIIMMTVADKFDAHVAELEKLFTGVPSIGCIAMGYDTKVTEKGVAITAYTEGVTVSTGVLENVSVAPAKNIDRLIADIEKVKPGMNNTAIIDFCAANDACVMNTVIGLLNKYHIELMGATGDAGKVSANGKIYPDGMAYAVIKNDQGKVKAYKENIYSPIEGVRLIA